MLCAQGYQGNPALEIIRAHPAQVATMPLTKKRPGRWTLRALLPWLVGAIPVVSGVLIMH